MYSTILTTGDAQIIFIYMYLSKRNDDHSSVSVYMYSTM